MKYLLVLIICLNLLLTGCPKSEKAAEQPLDDEKLIVSEFIYHHYADPTGDVFAYRTTPEREHEDESGHRIETVKFCLASIPSGEKFVEYEVTNDLVTFSPDGAYALKVIALSGDDRRGGFELALCRTTDDSELWRNIVGTEGELPPINFIWDQNKDLLIVISMKLPEDMPSDSQSIEDLYGDTKAFLQASQPTFIRVFRLNDGQLLGENEMVLSEFESILCHIQSRYGGGKIFVAAKDDPFAENRDINKEHDDIYSIDPISWKTEKIDTRNRGVNFTMGCLFVTDKGDKLLFQPDVRDPDNKLTNLGNDIIEIDLVTCEWNTLLEKSSESVYELAGITPDGGKVLCYEISRGEDRKSVFRTLVLDVATGERIYIDNVKDLRELIQCQISASGRYVIESYFFQDIWLHDLETGEVKLLVSPEEGYIVLNIPGIPGQWNSRF